MGALYLLRTDLEFPGEDLVRTIFLATFSSPEREDVCRGIDVFVLMLVPSLKSMAQVVPQICGYHESQSVRAPVSRTLQGGS